MNTYVEMLQLVVILRQLMEDKTECLKPKHLGDTLNEAVKRELIPRGLYDKAMQILITIYSNG